MQSRKRKHGATLRHRTIVKLWMFGNCCAQSFDMWSILWVKLVFSLKWQRVVIWCEQNDCHCMRWYCLSPFLIECSRSSSTVSQYWTINHWWTFNAKLILQRKWKETKRIKVTQSMWQRQIWNNRGDQLFALPWNVVCKTGWNISNWQPASLTRIYFFRSVWFNVKPNWFVILLIERKWTHVVRPRERLKYKTVNFTTS